MADAIDNEWVDGRSAIDIFVKKNNGVGYTYDDLILMPGALRYYPAQRGGMLRDERCGSCCWLLLLLGGRCRSHRLATSMLKLSEMRQRRSGDSDRRAPCCCTSRDATAPLAS